MAGKKLVTAKIRCINRATKEFFDREFWIDLSTLLPADRERFEELSKDSVSPASFIQIRSLLKPGRFPGDMNPGHFDSFRGFTVTDYFEDEAGNPLDMVGLAQILSGQEYPILLYDVRSVLRLGPTGIARKEQWTVESANVMAHFFQLVEVIGSGEWLKSKLSISTPGSQEWINSFQCPDLAHVYAILLPIRQLYAADTAFNRACKLYLRHVNDDRKCWWVEATKKNFNGYLDSVPRPLAVESYTVRQLLDLVMYGAGLVHSAKSEAVMIQNFKEAVVRNKREWVVFNFLAYCQQLYAYAAQVYFILRQDYEQWMTVEGCQPSDLVLLSHLFLSHPLRPDDVV